MALEKTVEEQLQEELTALGRVVRFQQERGEPHHEIEVRTAQFEVDWNDRFMTEQRAEITGSKVAVEIAVNKFSEQERYQAYMRDSKLLPAMSPTARDLFWNSSSRGNSLSDERDQAELKMDITKSVTESINDKFSHLRYGLVQAIQEIEHGKEPSLTELLSQQLKKEQTHPQSSERNQRLVSILNSELEKQRGIEHDL